MAKSFFERLTGSVRVNDDMAEAGREKPAFSATPKPIREKKPPILATLPESKKILHPVATEEASMSDRSEAEDVPEEGQLTVDIYDDGPTMVIQSTVAGVKPDDIDISLQGETLTIRGSRKRAQEVSEDNFYYRELYWGTFSRSIILPEEVDFQKAQAAIKNGLLTVRLPKKDKGEKKIQVKVGD